MRFTNINLMGLQFPRLGLYMVLFPPFPLSKQYKTICSSGLVPKPGCQNRSFFYAHQTRISLILKVYWLEVAVPFFLYDYCYLHLGDPDLGYKVINVLSHKCIWKYSFNAWTILVSWATTLLAIIHNTVTSYFSILFCVLHYWRCVYGGDFYFLTPRSKTVAIILFLNRKSILMSFWHLSAVAGEALCNIFFLWNLFLIDFLIWA